MEVGAVKQAFNNEVTILVIVIFGKLITAYPEGKRHEVCLPVVIDVTTMTREWCFNAQLCF